MIQSMLFTMVYIGIGFIIQQMFFRMFASFSEELKKQVEAKRTFRIEIFLIPIIWPFTIGCFIYGLIRSFQNS